MIPFYDPNTENYISHKFFAHVHYLTFPIVPPRGHNSNHGWETVVTRAEILSDQIARIKEGNRKYNFHKLSFTVHKPFVKQVLDPMQYDQGIPIQAIILHIETTI